VNLGSGTSAPPFVQRTLLSFLPLVVGALAKAPLVVFAPLLFAYAMLFEGRKPRRTLLLRRAAAVRAESRSFLQRRIDFARSWCP
jgi:hypothetical protein